METTFKYLNEAIDSVSTIYASKKRGIEIPVEFFNKHGTKTLQIVRIKGGKYTYQYICADCGEVLDEEEFFNTDTERVCVTCSENYYYCDKCREIECVDSCTWYNEEVYCQNCSDMFLFVCDDCGIIEHIDNMTTTYNNARVCDSCIDRNYFFCDFCSDYFRMNDSCNCEEEEAAEEEECDCLRQYSYKPQPNFFGKTNRDEFYGIELECETTNKNRSEAVSNVVDLLGDNYIYIKKDASLDADNGYEIVTHPATYDYHIQNICEQVNKISKHSTSYKSGNCGIHIHVSRKYIGENRESENITIGKLLFFFANNEAFIETIAQRSACSWSIIDQKSDIVKKIKCQSSSERYRAINLKNKNTIEFRIFRGTLKQSSFIKNLQFVKTIIDFCKSVNFTKLTVLEYRKYLENYNYPELTNFITLKLN